MKKRILFAIMCLSLCVSTPALAETSNDYAIDTSYGSTIQSDDGVKQDDVSTDYVMPGIGEPVVQTPAPVKEEVPTIGEAAKDAAVNLGESILSNNKFNVIVLLVLGISLAIVLKRNARYRKDE